MVQDIGLEVIGEGSSRFLPGIARRFRLPSSHCDIAGFLRMLPTRLRNSIS